MSGRAVAGKILPLWDTIFLKMHEVSNYYLNCDLRYIMTLCVGGGGGVDLCSMLGCLYAQKSMTNDFVYVCVCWGRGWEGGREAQGVQIPSWYHECLMQW